MYTTTINSNLSTAFSKPPATLTISLKPFILHTQFQHGSKNNITTRYHNNKSAGMKMKPEERTGDFSSFPPKTGLRPLNFSGKSYFPHTHTLIDDCWKLQIMAANFFPFINFPKFSVVIFIEFQLFISKLTTKRISKQKKYVPTSTFTRQKKVTKF